jgi:hypothetical protein
MSYELKTPVAMLIYRRPHTTEKVFEAVRQAKPPKLLVVANAPRPEKEGEAEKCAQTRAIIERVDWDCEVLTNYADSYLSCLGRIYSGLDWVFNTVEQAIILEDDCVPHPSFFRYCQELLEHYQDDERIVAVCGDNFQMGRRRTEDSYYFSRYTHFWGWASWRRAWQNYDPEMKLWPELRDKGWLTDVLGDPKAVRWWRNTFQTTYDKGIDTWDWQWIFASWVQNGLAIAPNVNLVSNIGFNAAAAHTGDVYDWRANMPTQEMTFPLKHPQAVIQNAKADAFEQQEYYDFLTNQRALKHRLRRKIRRAKRILQESRNGQDYGGVFGLLGQMVKG